MAQRPLVVVAPIKSALRLTAMNDAAARLGLRLGMALADARAMHPRLDVKDADPLADRHLIESIADWCDRYTPLVGLQPPDGLILDISGCAHLFGGEAALACDLVRRMRDHGFTVRAAVADTVGCAWGVARYGTLSLPRGGRVVGETDRVGGKPQGREKRPPPGAQERADPGSSPGQALPRCAGEGVLRPGSRHGGLPAAG